MSIEDINLASSSSCTGCDVCRIVCPVDAIRTVKDDFGFSYPMIDRDKCIRCGQCVKSCHILQDIERGYPKKTYASRAKNHKILKDSASGGAFSVLAESFIKDGGVVYGCTWNKNNSWKPQIVRINKICDVGLIQGSKYLESSSSDSYIQVKEDLKRGKKVLYGARPCQIAALLCFLKSDDITNLNTIDIVCHGVPSWELFHSYINCLEEKNGGSILDYRFRAHNKSNNRGYFGSYTINKQNKKIKRPILWECDSYYYYFMKSVICRQSCYSCKYACRNRVGDLSLGDFWGIEKQIKGEVPGNISLLLINSKKGEKLLENEIDLTLTSTDVEESCKYNGQLNHPVQEPLELRHDFFEKYQVGNWKEIERYFFKKGRIRRLRTRINYMIPSSIKDLLKKI